MTKTSASRWPTSPAEIGMLVLTAMIVVSVIGQTFLMYKQSVILAEADRRAAEAARREEDRKKPNLLVKRWDRPAFQHTTDAVFFTVINASPFAISVVDMELVVAVESDEDRWRTGRGTIALPRAYKTRNGGARYGKSDGATLRLEYGESVSDGFDVDSLIARFRTNLGHSVLVRFECRDALGNVYVSDGWYAWERDARGAVRTTVADSPGRGVVPHSFIVSEPWPNVDEDPPSDLADLRALVGGI